MRYLVTAGPTHEPIDDVRYIANRSSGRMGIAIAAAASEAGHATTLLLGPVSAPEVPGVRCRRFRTADELSQLLTAEAPAADLVIMAAAVADFRPAGSPNRPFAQGKLERGAAFTLELEPVPDLIAGIAASRSPHQIHQIIVGFALEEPDRLAERARAKLARKSLDAIVANPLSTMDSDRIRATLLLADGGERQPVPADLTKPEFARWLIGELDRLAIARRANGRGPGAGHG